MSAVERDLVTGAGVGVANVGSARVRVHSHSVGGIRQGCRAIGRQSDQVAPNSRLSRALEFNASAGRASNDIARANSYSREKSTLDYYRSASRHGLCTR